MASVALCPRCSHDLLVPSDTDPDAWAQCSACDVLFQVRDAITRELAELRLVEPLPELPADDYAETPHEPARDVSQSPHPTPTIAISSQKTVGDLGSLAGGSDISLLDVTVGDEATPAFVPKRSAPTIEDIMKSSAPTWNESVAEGKETHRAAGETPAETDTNPASARTIEDIPIPPLSPPARAGATIELSGEPLDDADTDFELENSSEPPQTIESLATWDDSEQMKRLLSGGDALPSDDAPTPLLQDDPVAEGEAAPAGQPFVNTEMFSMSSGPRSRRRRRSLVRMFTGIVISGIIGIGLGALALLWMLGPNGDFLDMARYLPHAILPAEFAATPVPVPENEGTLARIDEHAEPAAFSEPVNVSESLPQEPASFSEPANTAPAVVGLGSTGTPESKTPILSYAPSYTRDQFSIALRAGSEAVPGLTIGDLRDPQVQKTKGLSYSRLCELAEIVTFVDANTLEDGSHGGGDAVKRGGVGILAEALDEPRIRAEVARIVPVWIASKSRTNPGIFFAGKLTSQTKMDRVIECRVDTGGDPLTILVPEDFMEPDNLAQNFGPERPVAIIGSIVDRPAERVAGYTGDAQQVVWVGGLEPLE